MQKLDLSLSFSTKINLEWIKTFNRRPKTLKTGETLKTLVQAAIFWIGLQKHRKQPTE
jgi:hypothetical protein